MPWNWRPGGVCTKCHLDRMAVEMAERAACEREAGKLDVPELPPAFVIKSRDGGPSQHFSIPKRLMRRRR